MPTVYPDLRYPATMSPAATRYRRVVAGSTASGLATITNHLVGARCRRAVHYRVDWSANTSSGLYLRLNDKSPAVSRTHRIWWRSHDLAEHVVVVFQYMAGPNGLSVGAELRVDATLSIKGGAIIDGLDAASAGVFWSTHEGSLANYNQGLAAVNNNTLIYVNDINVASTGATPQDNVAAGGTFPTAPRPLMVAAAARGGWLELKMTTSNVRILAVDAWEMAEQGITT